jgi:uncharacterized protein YdhG (YjbR/CyaY superfamily)
MRRAISTISGASEGDLMSAGQEAHGTIDEYIASFPNDIQKILEKIRATVKAASPGAEEAIKYGMPTLVLNGNLVHFAAFKNHIGMYPAPSGIEQFQSELTTFEVSKGTIRFPLDKPIPYDLIGRITEFRVRENLAKAAAKGGKR